jgi:16S rRNA (cytosine1407-C5)-methyltransferase
MSHKRKNHSTSNRAGVLSDTTLKRYQPLLGLQNFEDLKQELSKPLETTIRINLLRHQPQEMKENLQRLYGWQLTQVPFCTSGFRIEALQPSPSNTIEHRLGDFYIQEAASMLPAELFELDQVPHPLILDMAASPGGKTIHLADRSRDCGLIIANDSSRSRIPALQVVLQKWGVINQAVTCMPGEIFGEITRDTFDLVLLDAPCSMEGLRVSASHPMRAISEKERQRLALRQQKLLESALLAVKTGGQIVYSTCTLAPEEDESVLAALLEKYPEAFNIDNLHKKLPFQAHGLVQYGENHYPKEIGHALRLWPHICHTAGFFAARLTKKMPIILQNRTQGQIRKNREVPLLTRGQVKSIAQKINDQYGFDLIALIERQQLGISQFEKTIFLIPNLYLEHFNDLPRVSIGLRMGELIENEIIPSHEFASRFGQVFNNGKIILEEENIPQWLRGEDLRGYSIPALPKSRVVIVTDSNGRNFGRGKVLASQLKNLLPNRLF